MTARCELPDCTGWLLDEARDCLQATTCSQAILPTLQIVSTAPPVRASKESETPSTRRDVLRQRILRQRILPDAIELVVACEQTDEPRARHRQVKT